MDRFQQLMLRSKQSGSNKILKHEPKLSELSEGVPVFAHTKKGLRQYTKYNNVVYESAFSSLNKTDQNQILTPDYDSGWIDVTKNTDYNFDHNLGSKMLRLEVYFKSDAGSIWNVTSTSLHEIFDSPTNKGTGVEVLMNTSNRITTKLGNYNIFVSHDGTEIDDGYLRILAWKTGVGE
jgi:hypothetical protein